MDTHAGLMPFPTIHKRDTSLDYAVENKTTDEPTRPTLLIVDDLPANLGVLLDFLDTAGYDVLVAESGAGALLQLEYARPDIILLDVQMPGGMDGYATCERLKADERWRDIPVLFVTALSEPVDKVRGFAVGAVDFITKPLHPEEVLARVRAHVQIRALQRSLEEKQRPAATRRRAAYRSRGTPRAIARPCRARGA